MEGINGIEDDIDLKISKYYDEIVQNEDKNKIEEDLINEICEYYYKNDDEKTLDKYSLKVNSLRSPKVAFWLLDNIKSANKGIYKKNMESIILNSNDYYWITMYAKCIKGAHKLFAEAKILSMHNPYANYFYCLNVKSKDLRAHEYNFYLSNDDPKLAYLFAKNIKKSDKTLHFINVIEAGDLDYINLFNNEIGNNLYIDNAFSSYKNVKTR